MSSPDKPLEIAGSTDRGMLRERNEDNLAVDETLRVAVVADGMGGLQDGHVASRVAVAAVIAHLAAAARPLNAAALEAALAAANEQVLAHARSTDCVMGTTAVAVAMDADRCSVAYAGDSRVYHFHHGQLSLVTRDHSLVQEMVDRGLLTAEAARRSPSRNIVTRALGLDAAFRADSTEFPVTSGDLLLLCSDGLWDMLEDQRIAALLAQCRPGRQALEGCVEALVKGANEAGGLDNVTVVLARLP